MQVNPEDDPPEIYVTWSDPRMTDFENSPNLFCFFGLATDYFPAFAGTATIMTIPEERRGVYESWENKCISLFLNKMLRGS